jgi:G patch domain/KOW motif-containing protein
MRRDPDPPLAEDPDLQAYTQQPVENYGLAMLTAMGFTKERGIGQRKSGLTEPLVLKARPRGLGLGAEQ